MKVIVLGGGVIGLTSAWYLSLQGHSVTVVDRQSECGKETSFANAGQISYGYSSPWAAPGIPIKAIQWLMQEHAPLKIKPSLSPAMLSWASKMLKNCSDSHYNTNKSRMLRLANYSRTCLGELRTHTDIQYQGRQLGTLQVFRNSKQLIAIEKDMALLKKSHTQFSLLDTQGCIEKEPALKRVKDKIVGGLHLPDDETGDCFLFCQQLAELAKQAGVHFHFDTDIHSLTPKNGAIESVETSIGSLQADHYVVACGSYSAKLLAPLGIQLPTYPVKGYSLTLPIDHVEHAPQSTVMDETYKVAITRFEDRLRIAGTAELTDFDLSIPEKRKATINRVVNDLFPDVGDFEQAQYWTGLRPMTPDGTPVIGKTPIKNLFTNTGHGTLGWTMACGSGQLIADIVSNKTPQIEHHDLSIQRYL
ncbi:D-amino acid dehydrogenase [Vibrio genomosp. F10]|uniref:D-amino acid dehydrogenase n=1 Tax=Vibrio genomosp. F10 TaxID=723171 RepID=A0A1B9R1M4_9VIBR|nr:D-amino acid dehydrogenase [Vibrio genomosp. F10]OCH78048.1 D-amino acid dehydrogenase small subunit [Vibrio genomosp. F10]